MTQKQAYLGFILDAVSPDSTNVYEWYITSEIDANKTTGLPSTKTWMRHEVIHSRISEVQDEIWVAQGLAQEGTLTLVTNDELQDTDSEIEYNDIRYEITAYRKKVSGIGALYTYLISRKANQ